MNSRDFFKILESNDIKFVNHVKPGYEQLLTIEFNGYDTTLYIISTTYYTVYRNIKVKIMHNKARIMATFHSELIGGSMPCDLFIEINQKISKALKGINAFGF